MPLAKGTDRASSTARRVCHASAAFAASCLCLGGILAATAADGPAATSVRGVVRAEATATISSELVARVASIPFKVGQSFRAGDVLITFDCRRYEADLRAAEAEVKTQEITLETNRQLLKHRATGTNDLALAEAKHAQALATADSLRIRTGQCVITAPYDGRVVDRLVDLFEMPQASAPLMKIVKDGQVEVDLIIPSHWSLWLKSGHEFQFHVEETKTSHLARVLNLGAVVDPVSRTMKVTGVLVTPDPLVRPGMSGSALLRTPAQESK